MALRVVALRLFDSLLRDEVLVPVRDEEELLLPARDDCEVVALLLRLDEERDVLLERLAPFSLSLLSRVETA